jgi:peroxiredoxin family protein
MFELTKDDFIDEIDEVITVGEFYDKAAGGQIIFT